MTTDAKNAFAAMFKKTVLDFRFGTDQPLTRPVTYVAAENGLFEIRMNGIGRFVRKIDGVPGMGHVATGFHWGLPNKIPWGFFEKTVSFFRAVMQRHGGAEAYIQFLFDREEGKYFAYVPRQYVSWAHVSFDRDGELEARHVLVLEAHSHHSMGAWFSGTDNADEQGDRLFMVIGRLDGRIPQVKIRYGMAGHHEELSIEEVFSPPVGEEQNQSWLDQVNPTKARRLEHAVDQLYGEAGWADLEPAEMHSLASRSCSSPSLPGMGDPAEEPQSVPFKNGQPVEAPTLEPDTARGRWG
jgi:PRTRC genetic system protein A